LLRDGYYWNLDFKLAHFPGLKIVAGPLGSV
jgi:hypothetical protein